MSTIGAPRCDTDACLLGQGSGDGLSNAVNKGLVLVGGSMVAGGATVSFGGWASCPLTEGAGCVAGAAGSIAAAEGVAVAGYGGAGMLYMQARGDGGGCDNASPKDKIVGDRQIGEIAKKNGYNDFHALKKDYLPQNDKSKWDGFFTKGGELYFKRKPLQGEEFEPIHTNLYK